MIGSTDIGLDGVRRTITQLIYKLKPTNYYEYTQCENFGC